MRKQLLVIITLCCLLTLPTFAQDDLADGLEAYDARGLRHRPSLL